MRIPTKITLSCIWVAIPVDWVIWHWYAWVADGRSLGRAGGRCTVTWLPNFLGWVDYFIFLLMVLRWRDSRESSAITASQMAKQMVTLRIKMHRSRVSDGFDHFTRVCPASLPYFLSTNSLRNVFAALAKQFRTFIFVLFCFVLFFSNFFLYLYCFCFKKIKSLTSYFGIMILLYRFDFW